MKYLVKFYFIDGGEREYRLDARNRKYLKRLLQSRMSNNTIIFDEKVGFERVIMLDKVKEITIEEDKVEQFRNEIRQELGEVKEDIGKILNRQEVKEEK